ncbi:cupin domain-containing protein [Legionella sp.]|uniref:cupin domain-containing protein n=1 Tax=Legionella sp. TaxID=459 RepID=UPI000CC12CAF|nr:cupin domain-containing protein [Legionella sp.]PJE07034.1 MAG: cupin [Legionella sp.]
MNTQLIPNDYQHISPAGAEVRLLMNNHLGGMAHCTLKVGTISKAVRHKTVSEFWHVLSGKGAIWRQLNGQESITQLRAGVSIDIPLGTDFQYRSDAEDLVFICITMPPWTGSDEASVVAKGAWQPSTE